MFWGSYKAQKEPTFGGSLNGKVRWRRSPRRVGVRPPREGGPQPCSADGDGSYGFDVRARQLTPPPRNHIIIFRVLIILELKHTSFATAQHSRRRHRSANVTKDRGATRNPQESTRNPLHSLARHPHRSAPAWRVADPLRARLCTDRASPKNSSGILAQGLHSFAF